MAASILLAGCGPSTKPEAADAEEMPVVAPTVAEVVPTPMSARDFTLESLDGESVSLQELRGQWVLVNFWATWCPPCVSEMPYLQQVADERDMAVLGVNFKESEAAVERFVAENDITFPILMNPDELLLLFYQARSLPRTHVIDPEGNIALSIIGAVDEERFGAWLERQGVPRK
jgi:thiol-disulfide isomerase/thioredoxin